MSSTITAEDFPLRAYFTLGAAIDLEKAHGLNLEDELVKYLGGEVKFTMDHLGIDLMLQASQNTLPGQTGTSLATGGALGLPATDNGTYTAAPTTGETWVNSFLPTIKVLNSVDILYGYRLFLN